MIGSLEKTVFWIFQGSWKQLMLILSSWTLSERKRQIKELITYLLYKEYWYECI